MRSYEFDNYKEFIRARIKAMPAGGHGEIGKIAAALKTHSTRISHIINGGVHFTPEQGLRPASDALRDAGLRSAMIDSLTTRKPGFMGRNGHDQFFTAFDRYGPVANKR